MNFTHHLADQADGQLWDNFGAAAKFLGTNHHESAGMSQVRTLAQTLLTKI